MEQETPLLIHGERLHRQRRRPLSLHPHDTVPRHPMGLGVRRRLRHRKLLDAFKRSLRLKFEMDDQGEIHYVLGITISRDRP
jgi:hypothetical protein